MRANCAQGLLDDLYIGIVIAIVKQEMVLYMLVRNTRISLCALIILPHYTWFTVYLRSKRLLYVVV